MQFKFTVSPILPCGNPTRWTQHVVALHIPLAADRRAQGGYSQRPLGLFLRGRNEGRGKSRSVRNTA